MTQQPKASNGKMLTECFWPALWGGLWGIPGKQTRYASPRTFEHALSIALTVQEAGKQEKFNETFYTSFDDSVRLLSRSPSRPRRECSSSRRSADTQVVNHPRDQRYRTPRGTNKPSNSGTSNEQTKAAIRCYECNGLVHYDRECPTRLKREEHPSGSRGSSDQNRRPRISHPPHKPPRVQKGEARERETSQGNE